MKTVTLSNRSRAPRIAARAKRDRRPSKTLQIRNVLVPTDFSQPSLKAIEFALPLIKRFGANLHLVHVFAPIYPPTSLAATPLIVPEPEVGRRVRRHLRDVAKKYSADLPLENMHPLRGRPFEEICRFAREKGMDMIVISTRGNTGLKHLLLGSTAERVVRYSPCPVLVVRTVESKKKAGRNGKSQRTLGFKKILVPIDFSGSSMKGLDYAKALAKEFDATLVLLHSVHLQYYVTSDEYARYDFPLLMQQSEKVAGEQMRELVRKTDWEGIKVEPSLQIGHAGDQICTRAKDHGADLIVTSTHGRTGLKRMLIGSTAEFVVRYVPCPVLVVPSHERPVLKPTKTRT